MYVISTDQRESKLDQRWGIIDEETMVWKYNFEEEIYALDRWSEETQKSDQWSGKCTTKINVGESLMRKPWFENMILRGKSMCYIDGPERLKIRSMAWIDFGEGYCGSTRKR